MELGISLIINLCAEEHVAPFKVYEGGGDAGVPRYRRINSLSEFAEQLDDYTKKVASPDARDRKVFLRNIAAVDAPNYEIDRHFPETCALIELVMTNRAKIAATEPDLARIPSVGVHCMVGVSRSASVVLAYLMKATGVSRDDALSFVQTTRWVVNPNPGFQQQLLLWEAVDCKRIFDDFSAELVASEVGKKRSVVSYVQKQLPTILKFNKCSGEREYFGFVVAKGVSSPGPTDDAGAVYRELRSYITAAVDNEVYADTPNFFGYVAEVVNSIQCHAPVLLFQASAEAQEVGLAWSDVFHYRVMKDIGRSGFVKDTCDTVRAFCSLLEAIHVKQLAHSPLHLVSRPPDESPGTPASPCIALSFPFLPFMAPYAEGFVEFSDLNILEEQYPAQGTPLGQEEGNALAKRVASMFLSSFLVSTTGASPSAARRNEEEVSEVVGTVGATSSAGRGGSKWASTSRLLFLQSDVEVAVLETLSQSNDAADVQVDDLLALCTGCSDKHSALTGARKIGAGILAFRLILETADRFVCDAYRDRLPPNATIRLSDTCFPLGHVNALLEGVGHAFTRQFNRPCDLQQFFRVELEPLVQSKVMRTDGVWSILKKD